MKLWNKIKWRHQRIKRGYDDRDVWNIDYWFLEHIVPMLKQLRDTKIGTPMSSFPEVDNFPNNWVQEEVRNLERWKNIHQYNEPVDLSIHENGPNSDRYWILLSRMIWCFEEANPDKELENTYWEIIWNNYFCKNNTDNIPDELHKKFINKAEENNNYKEQCLNEGLDLFKKYFYTLWD